MVLLDLFNGMSQAKASNISEFAKLGTTWIQNTDKEFVILIGFLVTILYVVRPIWTDDYGIFSCF